MHSVKTTTGRETTTFTGATSCAACGLGQYGFVPGNCTKCPESTYQNEKKQTECLHCKKDGWIPNEQATGCEAPQHKVVSDCDFVNQYFDDSSSNSKDWFCAPCPLGGFCKGFITWEKVQPKYGYWRTHEPGEATGSKALHNMEFAALTVCWFTFWSGLLFLNVVNVNEIVLSVTNLVIFAANAFFLAVATIIFFKEYLRDKRNMRKRKSTAAALAAVTGGGLQMVSNTKVMPTTKKNG